MYRVGRPVLFVILACGLLGGCATVLGSSNLASSPQEIHNATMTTTYTLAKGLVKVELFTKADTATFMVCVEEPTPVEDEKHQFRLVWHNSWFSADKFRVERYQDSNILKSIYVETHEQTDNFVVQLASSAGGFAAAGRLKKEHAKELADIGNDVNKTCSAASGFQSVAQVFMDPANRVDVKSKLDKLNRFAHAAIDDNIRRRCGKTEPPTLKPEQVSPEKAACAEYRRLRKRYDGDDVPLIELRWVPPQGPRGIEITADVVPKPDCTVGLCYRTVLPFMVYVSVGGGAPVSQRFFLPNRSPLIAMDLSRGFAITKTSLIGFNHLGQPEKFYLRKGNDEDGRNGAELVEASKLPLLVVNAYFDTFAHSISEVTRALQVPAVKFQETSLDLGIQQYAYLTDEQKTAAGAVYARDAFQPVFTMFADNSMFSLSAVKP